MSDTKDIAPQFVERKDIIKLGADINCDCGRVKDRAHCPCCGKVKLYGKTGTIMVLIPNTLITVKDCKRYRCMGCAEEFNDVDWYFNCHAPKKIDWAATKQLARNRDLKEWIDYIKSHGRLGYNDRQQFERETGKDAREIEDLLIAAMKRKPKTTMTTDEAIITLKDQLESTKLYMAEKAKTPEDIEDCLQDIKKLEEQIVQLEKIKEETKS